MSRLLHLAFRAPLKGDHQLLASSLYPQDEPWEFGELGFLVIPPKSAGLSYGMAFTCPSSDASFASKPFSPTRVSFLPCVRGSSEAFTKDPQLKTPLLPGG